MKTLNVSELRESVILKNQNQQIFGIFHKPAECEKFPVVLICHGLGGHKVGRYRVYVDVANQLSKMGIGSLRFDFRGSGDSEGHFSEMTLEGQVSDALLAFDFLKSHPQVDINRIGVMGRSFGGAIAVIASSQFQNVKSLCLWAPIFNAQQWKDKWEKLQSPTLSASHKAEIIAVNGQVPGMELLKQFVRLRMEDYLPALHSKPLFVLHGAKDEVVHINNAEKYLHARMQASSTTKFTQLPLSDHDFTPLHERQQALEETCQWFNSTL